MMEEYIMAPANMKTSFFITLTGLLLFGMSFGVLTAAAIEKKTEIGRLSQSRTEDVHLNDVRLSFFLGSAGIIVSYKIENNSCHSSAYWMPGRKDQFELWK